MTKSQTVEGAAGPPAPMSRTPMVRTSDICIGSGRGWGYRTVNKRLFLNILLTNPSYKVIHLTKTQVGVGALQKLDG